VWLVPKIFFWLSHLLFRSCRLRFVGKEHEDVYLRDGRPICFAGLHQGHALPADALPRPRRCGDGEREPRRRSHRAHDGAFGLRSARGSSKHGGADALRAMIDEVNASGCSAGMIVDGHAGPAGVAKPAR
jgi:lysophospholipid acyltransferase (LPLAT)-like uncharacterized protein